MKKLLSLILVLAIALSLCACGKADDYESAIALMEAGNYEEAIVAFTELGDYEDSVQKLEECENILAYTKAVALFEAEQYEDALVIFTALGDYQDSLEKNLECENALAYQAALDLIASGDYENAYTALVELGDYEDVPELLTHFKEVEITTENWSDYFVVLENPQFTKNDFGEITDIGFCYILKLKEELSDCIYNSTESTAIFEFSITTVPHHIQFDSISGDYEILSPKYFYDNIEEKKTLTWVMMDSEQNKIYESSIWWEAVEAGQEPHFDWYLAENFEATRTQGSIFIYE